jgi:c-di-GMP-binding flagellar brake protein YcgR
MTKRKKDASIVAHKEKAPELRTLASQLSLKFSELDVPGNDKVIRFTFKISDEDLTRLLQMVPRDVFAYHAIVGGSTK